MGSQSCSDSAAVEMSRLVILATLLSFLGCSVYGNSDSDTKPLRTVEDISLNTLDGLGSLNSLNNLVTSSLEASQEFLPLALYYKNNAENIPAAQSDQAYQPPPSYPPSSTSSAVTASEAENIRKVKRFPGKNRKHQDTSPQPDPRPVTGRFSPNSRPVPRTPNLVLEDEFNSNNNSHLELEDYFGTPEPPTAEDSKEVLVTDPPKIRIKHKSDPFIRNNPGPGPGLRTHSPNTSASQPFPRTNHKKKILKRPATKVKTNRRSGFQTGKGYKSFLTNPRPGKRPHKIRITSASRPLGDKPPPTNRDLIPEDISEASLSVVTPGIYQTTASSIIREVTLKPEVSLNDFSLSKVNNVNQFENFADKKSVAQRKAFKKKPKLDFKKFLSPGKLELNNHDKLEPELSQRKKSKEPDVVISNQGRPSSTDGGGGFLSAQKTDLLDKLRSLTGGQVVAVTLDRVGKKSHIDTKRDHDEDGPDTSEVTIKQRETKDMSSQKREQSPRAFLRIILLRRSRSLCQLVPVSQASSNITKVTSRGSRKGSTRGKTGNSGTLSVSGRRGGQQQEM